MTEEPTPNTIRIKSSKNSWVKTIENSQMTKYLHYFFCKCGHSFKMHTAINSPIAPSTYCSNCGNDTFTDIDSFKKGELIDHMEHLHLGIKTFQNSMLWGMYAYMEIPTYIKQEEVVLRKKILLKIHMHKNGNPISGKIYDSYYYSYATNKYNIPIYKAPDSIDLMVMQVLYSFIMKHKTDEISWLEHKDFDDLSVDKKLQQINYLLKHPHIKELNFYYWDMTVLQNYTRKYPSEIQMLDYVCNHRKEKSIKKALYHTYNNAIIAKYYNPHCDYVFSRTIDDVNLLVKLINIDPDVKQKIFTDDDYLEGMELIVFLKNYYSEKQICKLFFKEILNKQALQYWKDIVRMMQRDNAFIDLEHYFHRVKLTTKHLHDEIIRALHLANFSYEGNAIFNYKDNQVFAQGMYDGLVYKLPFSAEELSLWSQILHNCMFGYIDTIQSGSSLIYGVFKDESLLYALELSGEKIVQAKAASNRSIPQEDMKKVEKWHKQYLGISTKSQESISCRDKYMKCCITI